MTETLQQGGNDWHLSRVGRVTASKLDAVMAKDTTALYNDYLMELVLQRITGNREEGFTNSFMQWGIDNEPEARAAYEAQMGCFVKEVGFYTHPRIEMSGASPDGLVEPDGLIEIKCPSSKTHADSLLTRKPATKYLYQMLWQMACTNRNWCDFVSFDPRFDDGLQLMIVRIPKDEVMIATLEKAVVAFLAKVDQMVIQLNAIRK